MSDTTNSSNLPGYMGLTDANSHENVRAFTIRQMLGRVRTGTPVKVIKVHGGGVGEPGTLDVQPLVHQVDGQGNFTPHGVIFSIPYTRNQGGDSAVINDPVVGDIGHVIVSDRDISKLQATSEAASPDSHRRFSLADSVWHGAILNKPTPKQYLLFNGDGVTLADRYGNKVVLKSGQIDVIPAPGAIVYLGGDPNKGDTFGFVQTDAGISKNVKAKI